jgi:hypothetical protein
MFGRFKKIFKFYEAIEAAHSLWVLIAMVFSGIGAVSITVWAYMAALHPILIVVIGLVVLATLLVLLLSGFYAYDWITSKRVGYVTNVTYTLESVSQAVSANDSNNGIFRMHLLLHNNNDFPVFVVIENFQWELGDTAVEASDIIKTKAMLPVGKTPIMSSTIEQHHATMAESGNYRFSLGIGKVFDKPKYEVEFAGNYKLQTRTKELVNYSVPTKFKTISSKVQKYDQH